MRQITPWTNVSISVSVTFRLRVPVMRRLRARDYAHLQPQCNYLRQMCHLAGLFWLFLLPDQEPVDRAISGGPQDGMPGPGGPGAHVDLDGGIVGDQLEGLAGAHLEEGLAGPDDRHRAVEADAVDHPMR